jgi:hypothetical protein
MAELTDLLKSVETELTGKIKEIYDKKLEEHIENISSNLSECYTKDYGKLDSNKYTWKEIDCELNKIQIFLNKISKNRYIIHWYYNDITEYSSRSSTRKYYVFDNFGDYIEFTKKFTSSYNFEPVHISGGYTPSKYILPNILIDLIKKNSSGLTTPCIDNWMYYDRERRDIKKISPLQQIKIIAEDYYNRLSVKKYLEDTTPKKEFIEIETQTDTTHEIIHEIIQESIQESIQETKPEPDKYLINNHQLIIKGNSLTIINYNKPELNLCDFLPKLTKDIEKEGRIIKDCNYTTIDKVHIVSSDFIKITKYYQGIKHISILDCPHYESMPSYLQKDLTYLSIDGVVKINITPPDYN